jgi:hypothetical protein
VRSHLLVQAYTDEAPAPHTSLAIVASVARAAPDSPRLDRYRNELAANALGIRAAKAATDGLATLRKLAAAAPPLDSDTAFLPQLRAVNLLKACQAWIAGDDADDEDEGEDEGALESAMTLVFASVAPVVQDVPGAHWELIFDVMENSLEARSSLFSRARALTTSAVDLSIRGRRHARRARAHAPAGADRTGPLHDKQGAPRDVGRTSAEGAHGRARHDRRAAARRGI